MAGFWRGARGMYVKLYLRAFFRHWVAAMTGLGGLIIALIRAVKNSNGLFITLIAGLGVLALFFAGYKAWAEEHERYEEEAKKNAQPDIRGEVSGPNLTQHLSSAGVPGMATFEFILYLCNYSGRKTNTKEIVVSVADDGGSQVKFSSITSSPPYQPIQLENGIGHALTVRASTKEVYGTLDLDSLVVHVVDGLGGPDPFPLRARESLSVGPQAVPMTEDK